MRVCGREIGAGRPPLVIAELGVNHDGSAERALALVDAAAGAGADAVKVQWFEAERLMSRASRLAGYQREAGERDPVEMLRRLELGADAMAAVVDRAHARGVAAIVTVFSAALVPGAVSLAWDAYKTASPDIIHRPLLEALCAAGKPLIVSTGAAELQEVLRASLWLEDARREGRLAFLQCVSSYPAADEDAALGGMAALSGALDLPIGYSDHTAGIDTGELAVSLGAVILEKHVTHSRAAAGPDHAASLEPAGFAEYARRARAAAGLGSTARAALAERARRDRRFGTDQKVVLPCERDVRHVSRQSIVAARALRSGESLRAEDLTVKRPGTGLPPFRMRSVIGRTLARDVERDMPLQEADVATQASGAAA